jgi:hypothetical protein
MKTINQLVFWVFSAFFSFLVYSTSVYGNTEKSVIDVLFLYSDGVKELYQEGTPTRINHLIETTNTIFSTSNANVEIRPVEILPHQINEKITPLQFMLRAKNDESILQLKDQYSADVVMIYTPFQEGQPCGLSYRPATFNGAWRGLTYAAVNCGAYVTAHEIGHAMGLAHSHAQRSTTLLPYAMGHGVQGEFATVMAYTTAYQAPKIYKFSSPKLNCHGLPCGIEEGNALQADAVKAMQKTAPILAALKDSSIDDTCNINRPKVLEEIEKNYQSQQQYVNRLNEHLQELESKKAVNKERYDDALATYKKEVYQVYFPNYREYKSLVNDLRGLLNKYNKGQVSRSDVVNKYQDYLATRAKLVKTIENIRVIYKNEYQPAVAAYNASKGALAQYKKNTYSPEQVKLAQLQAAYEEAKAAYQCYA